MKLPSAWYAICSSNEIKPGRLHALKRFNENLVLWRQKDGTAVALKDWCAHRSAKLSAGHLTAEGHVVCPFHGYQFNEQGKCAYAPEIKRDAPGLKVPKYHLQEKNGFVWAWYSLTNDAPMGEPPWFDSLNPQLSMSQFTTQWPMHFSRCVENQLDYSHLKFVHRRTIGGRSDPSRMPEFEFSEKTIKYTFTDNPGGAGTIEFHFGNLWRLTITERFSQVLAFVPVDEQTTLLYLRSYQGFVQIPGLRELVGLINNFSNRYILNEDKRVVLTQQPLDSAKASDETLMPSDRAIAHFRKIMNSN